MFLPFKLFVNKIYIIQMQKRFSVKTSLFLVIYLAMSGFVFAQWNFHTAYFKIHINGNGYITSMKNATVQPNQEFSPDDKPSPLLCLYNSGENQYYYPLKATYNAATRKMILRYANGAAATVLIEPKNEKYLRLTLLSLAGRKGIDNIQWGPVHTSITNILGEMLGVARDTSVDVNYAIGLLSLNDATTGGSATTVGGIAPFEYLIHSPDTKRFPLQPDLHEGQFFTIGGNGISDVAFYSHPEEYYRIMYGNAAGVDSMGRISIVQHATDRQKPKNIFFSLMPKMGANKPVHQELKPIPGVDYIGSKVALWGAPDTIALMTIIRNIVLSEELPYPVLNGKWVKDPARYVPDVLWNGKTYDSAVSYTAQLGFKGIEGWSLGEYYPNRSDNGNIPLTIPFASGKKPISVLTDESNAKGIVFGLHTLQNFLQHRISSDVSPVPNDSLCYLQKRILKQNIDAADTAIVIDNPDYLDEIAGWEGHPADANIIKIGKELIHYMGVTKTQPYTLLHVKRGYWGTAAAAHNAGSTVYKLQTNCYRGLVPDIFLQDQYADYYANVFKKQGMHYIDFDGEEGLFYQGYGEYSAKRFYRRLFAAVRRNGIGLVRVTGATLSGGSWYYHSIWNVGGGEHMYNNKTRSWGIEGKDLRNVTFGNYFPSTFGGNFSLTPTSTVQDYENIEALSVGSGVTYVLDLSQSSVEACPQKYEIFKAIRTWENARAANAFPRTVKKMLSNINRQFHLEQIDNNTWKLSEVKSSGSDFLVMLKRAKGY
jgi:hypothetical protein